MGRKGILALVLVAFFATGCAAFAKLLPILTDIMVATQDATLYVDRAEDIARSWFAAHPNADQQEQVTRAIGVARNALIAANRSTRGATELSQEDYGAAFADFRTAWERLVDLFRTLGIGSGTFGAAPGESIEQTLGTPMAAEKPAP